MSQPWIKSKRRGLSYSTETRKPAQESSQPQIGLP
jgi:hypothetical protein